MRSLRWAVALGLATACAIQVASAQTSGESARKASSHVLQRMAAGQAQDLIVVFDNKEILRAASVMQSTAQRSDTSQSIEYKAARYAEKKRAIMSSFAAGEAEELKHYSHLPMAFVRIHSRQALDRLLARPEVVKVHEDRLEHRMLTESLPLIGQPQVAASGDTGAGTTVAVLDTGVDYTLPEFGSCTAPGVPAGCKVVVLQHFGSNLTALDQSPEGHGTNVAAIVAGVAPKTQIAALDVFSGDTASSSDIIAAGNWAIAHKSTYNIVAMNLSLGSGQYTSPETGVSGPYNTLVDSARAAGILTIAAAGNDGYTNALSSPGATSGVVSVGAVFDSAFGTVTFGSPALCTDISAADKVACFSNSASFLTMLAPGSQITAGGRTLSGTSQATPHVAGAVAVLRAAFPADTLDQTVARLTNGVQVTDSRNGIVKPRLSLPLAVGLTLPCSYVVSPTSVSYTAAGATGSNTVTAPSGCNWTAASNVNWITITSGSTGTGNGNVTYSVAANPGVSARSGTITIAGISVVVTQAGLPLYAYNIPSPSNVDQAFIRIYNTSNSLGALRVTLYDQNGNVLGAANSLLMAAIQANSVTVFTASDIAAAVNASDWAGRAWMIVQADSPALSSSLRIENLIRSSLLINMSCLESQYAFYLPSPDSISEQGYVRLYNPSGSAGAVRATLYDESGNVLGTASLLSSLAPNAVTVLGPSDIASAFGVSSWKGRAWMRLSSDFAGLKVMNTLRDLNTNTLTDVGCDGGSTGTSANAYNIPPPSPTATATTASIRIYNTASSRNTLTATLYGENGSILGSATLGTVAANSVLVLSQSDIVRALDANPNPWSGRAWMQVNSSIAGIRVVGFTKTAMLMDMSCVEGSYAFNIPDASNPTDQPIIRLYNTSSSSMNVHGTLYDMNGNVLGKADTALFSNMPAKSVATFLAGTLASAVGTLSWTGRSWLKLTSNSSGLKVMNILQDMVSGNWSNMSCATN